MEEERAQWILCTAAGRKGSPSWIVKGFHPYRVSETLPSAFSAPFLWCLLPLLPNGLWLQAIVGLPSHLTRAGWDHKALQGRNLVGKLKVP